MYNCYWFNWLLVVCFIWGYVDVIGIFGDLLFSKYDVDGVEVLFYGDVFY